MGPLGHVRSLVLFQGAERMWWRILRQESDMVRFSGSFGECLSPQCGGGAGSAAEREEDCCVRRTVAIPTRGLLGGWPHLDFGLYTQEEEESRIPPTRPPK